MPTPSGYPDKATENGYKNRNPEQDLELLDDAARPDDEPPKLAASIAAEEIYEASRTICHRPPSSMTPAELYELLGNLQGGYGHIASEALEHISSATRGMPDRLRLTHDEDGDPNQALFSASELLLQASAKARELGDLLNAAQSAVASVGHKPST